MSAVNDYLAHNAGYQMLLKSFPEAALIFASAEEAALGGTPWDQSVFLSKIQNTKWFRSTTAGARQYLFTQVFDPASATKDANDMARKILLQSESMGLHMTLQQGAALADQAIIGGWDDSRIAQEVVGATKYGPNLRLGPGTITAAQTQIRGIAGDYGVSLAPATAYSWGAKIADGLATTQSFSEYAKQQAKVSHPYWEKQLDQGLTVRQLADPYLQTAGRLLERDPSTLDLTDHRWANAFTTTDKAGAAQPMSQTDWARKLMTDPTYGWDHTQNAKDAAFQIADQIRSTFGAQ